MIYAARILKIADIFCEKGKVKYIFLINLENYLKIY